MYRTPIHFGALCKSTYNLTTRPRLNGLGRRNVRFYVHRGAAAKMFHFSFTVITYAYSIFSFSFFFPFFLFPFFPFFFFSFFPFLPPPSECRPGRISPSAPPSVRHWMLSSRIILLYIEFSFILVRINLCHCKWNTSPV